MINKFLSIQNASVKPMGAVQTVPGCNEYNGMQKILFILPSFDAGGAENYLLRFLPFIRSSATVYVVAPEGKNAALKSAFIQAGCRVISGTIGMPSVGNTFHFISLLRKQQFNTVCTLTGTFGGWALLLAWLCGVPVRIGWHRRSSNAFAPSLIRNSYNWLATGMLERFATRILSNSATALRFFHGMEWQKDSRYSIIQNGVAFAPKATCTTKAEAKKALGYSSEEFVVGHVGRLDQAKNHVTMMKIAALIQKSHPQVRFLFCGKDTDSAAFTSLLQECGVSKNCKGIGLHNTVASVYAAMDVFIFPSVTEGQPNALIEAAGAGLPVLASNIDAIREATPETFHHKLFNAADAPAYATAIVQMIEHPSNIQAYQLAEYVRERFDLTRNMLAFKKVLL